MTSAVFVTGSGTEVGKTHVAARMIRDWRAAGMRVDALKPVVSGHDEAALEGSDPGRLLAALGREVTSDSVARISPWRYAAPLSPDMAAAREGLEVPYGEVVSFCRSAVSRNRGRLVIEGIGGVMVPLDSERTILDLIAAIAIPAVLVGGSYVGSLSHTLSALAALRARHVIVERIVVSETPGSPAGLEETCETLRRFTDGVPVDPLAYDGMPHGPERGGLP